MKPTDFPLYARIPDASVYYIIHSSAHFEEWRMLGARYLHADVKSADFADSVYIMDLIEQVETGAIHRVEKEEMMDFVAKWK